MHMPHGRCIGVRKYETAGFLRRFCRNGSGDLLWDRPNRGGLVPGNKSAGVPRLLLLCTVGRVAARGEGRLGAVPAHALVKGTAGAARGFLPFETIASEWKEDVMTDPRFTDPRYNDPRLSDPVLRRDDSAAGGMWGWIAGVAVLLLIGFLIIAGWNNNSNTASTGSSPTATTRTAPSTTGSGSTSPKPATPAAPTAPAPAPAPSQGGG